MGDRSINGGTVSYHGRAPLPPRIVTVVRPPHTSAAWGPPVPDGGGQLVHVQRSMPPASLAMQPQQMQMHQQQEVFSPHYPLRQQQATCLPSPPPVFKSCVTLPTYFDVSRSGGDAQRRPSSSLSSPTRSAAGWQLRAVSEKNSCVNTLVENLPRRPLSDQFTSRPMGRSGIPQINAAFRPRSYVPAERVPHRSCVLSPTVFGNDVAMRVAVTEALQDASNFQVLPADTVNNLRREFQALAKCAAKLVPQLSKEEKIREAARNMILLYRENEIASLKAQEELAAANAKLDGCATELWHVTNRRMEVQKKVLEHTARVLALAVQKIDAAWEGVIAVPTVSGELAESAYPADYGHITSKEWETREDEFQAAFKLEYEKHSRERANLEATVQRFRQEIGDLKEVLKREDDTRNNYPSVRYLECATQTLDMPSNPTLSARDDVDAAAHQKVVENLNRVLGEKSEQFRKSLSDAKAETAFYQSKTAELNQVLAELHTSFTHGETEKDCIQVEHQKAMEAQARNAAQFREQLEDRRRELDVLSLGISPPVLHRAELPVKIEAAPQASPRTPSLPADIQFIVQESMRQVLAEREGRAAKEMQAEKERADELRKLIKEMEAKHVEIADKLAHAETELEMHNLRANGFEESGECLNLRGGDLEAVKANANAPSFAVGAAAGRAPESEVGNEEREDTDTLMKNKELHAELVQVKTDFSALQAYNGRLLELLKNLYSEVVARLEQNHRQAAAPRDGSAAIGPPKPADGVVEFSFEGFIGRVRSLLEENGLLLCQLHDLQSLTEKLTVDVDELTDKVAALTFEREEAKETALKTGSQLEEDKRKAAENAEKLAFEASELRKAHIGEIARVVAAHKEETKKVQDECEHDRKRLREALEEMMRLRENHEQEVKRRADEAAYVEVHLHRELDEAKRALDDAKAELSCRRKMAERFESDRMALEARAESAAAKAVRYRNELSEARLKPILDAADADGLEALRREFRRVMNDLRSEHAEQIRQDEEERRRLEALIMTLRRQNEDLVAEISARPAKTVCRQGGNCEAHSSNDYNSPNCSSAVRSDRRDSVGSFPKSVFSVASPMPQPSEDAAAFPSSGNSVSWNASSRPEPSFASRRTSRESPSYSVAPPASYVPSEARALLTVDRDAGSCQKAGFTPPDRFRSPTSDCQLQSQHGAPPPPVQPSASSSVSSQPGYFVAQPLPSNNTLPLAPFICGAPTPPAKQLKEKKKRFSFLNGL